MILTSVPKYEIYIPSEAVIHSGQSLENLEQSFGECPLIEKVEVQPEANSLQAFTADIEEKTMQGYQDGLALWIQGFAVSVI